MMKRHLFQSLLFVVPVVVASNAQAEEFYRPALTETIERLEAEIEDGDGERYADELETAKAHLEVAADYWDQRTGGGGSFNNRQIHWGVSLRRAVRGIQSIRRSRGRGGPGSLAAVERDLGTQMIAEIDQYFGVLEDRCNEPGAPEYWRDDVAAGEVLLQAARAEGVGQAKAEKAADAFDRVGDLSSRAMVLRVPAWRPPMAASRTRTCPPPSVSGTRGHTCAKPSTCSASTRALPPARRSGDRASNRHPGLCPRR